LPIVKGGIFDFHSGELTVGVGEEEMSDFAAMTFGECDGERVFGQLFERSLRLRRGRVIELFEDE